MDYDFGLSGQFICQLMRKHKKTIDSLAAEHSITKSRVRDVRANGVRGFLAAEWHYLITGKWLDKAGKIEVNA